MATTFVNFVNRQRVNGQPVHRFNLIATDDSTGEMIEQTFSTSWERSSRFYSLEKNGYTLTASNWDKETDTWIDATEAARTEGFNRANRAKKATSPEEKVAKPRPGLKPEVADAIKAHSDLSKLVATVGRKSGVDEETKKAFGMSAMETLTNVGYAPKEIKELCQAYLRSIDAQAQDHQK